MKYIDSIKNVFKLTNIFSQYSGLKLNVDKSVVSFIGVWRRLPKLEMNITLQNDSFNMLGIELGNNQFICHNINISNKIDRMATHLNICEPAQSITNWKGEHSKTYGNIKPNIQFKLCSM